ncbi:CDGSH iron-sulfur domain-containing protein [Bradyrhizobium sp. Pear77]|uniref:CDGSH iron-sulfur domain-containing protein n=1 Tax=Bradyrhizobium altum TaxID=1571202 RepID=UPI0028A06FAE|nr:CDGSH iron-sulfur domain-containing protein [Bradyrhizobium altum]MCC8952759.1 CDGSH iron-sulfur domain-containing protein [Bradyrhizobium altum]
MKAAKVTVFDNGPIHITGDFEVFDEAGNQFPNRKLFSLCRCGHSLRKPFCDGSHREARFSDVCRAEPPKVEGQASE